MGCAAPPRLTGSRQFLTLGGLTPSYLKDTP